jgi:putative ABC transport system permease protein
VKLLTKKFVFLLIIANVLAIPATWYIIGLWLSKFAYRIDMGFVAFLTPFAACALFTALSIGFHTTRAALENPVEALKCE